MIKITIDIGNSSTKLGFFDKNNLVSVDSIRNDDKKKLESIIKTSKADAVIISSVIAEEDYTWIKNEVKKVIILDSDTPLPFENLYTTPKTLGKDRLAAVAGAESLYSDKSVLIIDAGTAITYEIYHENKYLGGAISPGMNMRFKSLNSFTGKLPLVSKTEKPNFPGTNTQESIANGVINGMIFEIEGYRLYCKEKWGINLTLFTGGDSDFFARKLKKPIFVNQNLVLIGLNRILEHNA